MASNPRHKTRSWTPVRVCPECGSHLQLIGRRKGFFLRWIWFCTGDTNRDDTSCHYSSSEWDTFDEARSWKPDLEVKGDSERNEPT